MVTYKAHIDIQNHVTELKVKGYTNNYSNNLTGTPMTINGYADGRKFKLKTNGHMTLAEIVNLITKAVRT